MRCLLACAICWLGAMGGAGAQCVMDWAPGFGVPGVAGFGEGGAVRALAAFDDGAGPALYVGGNFHVAGDVVTDDIAVWDGARWGALPGGHFYEVNALVVWDDGTGPALYAATAQGGVLKWAGGTWVPLSGTMAYVYALAVYDDGTGPALYAGGDPSFDDPYDSVVRWDGSMWQPLGGGLWHWDFDPQVWSLCVYDDGRGPGLYVGGHFTRAGDLEARNIARWDGQAWTEVGLGVGGGYSDGVQALAVYDDSTGPALYAAGYFAYAGYVQANCVARWDGLEWSALGEGMRSEFQPAVMALEVFDGGSGPALMAGGEFSTAGEVDAFNLAAWDGASWSAVGSPGLDWIVCSLAACDDGRGRALYVGGEFTVAGAIGAHHVARWDGARWSPVGSGNGLAGTAYGLGQGALGDGSPPGLYVAGMLRSAGDVAVNTVARWDGLSWSALAAGTNCCAWAFAVYDDGSGPALYMGGDFTTAGDAAAASIARWDGAAWSSVGAGIEDGAVGALAVFDDGTGSALYVAGRFSVAGGVAANNIARWDGQSWSALGNGLTGPELSVGSMTVFNDGTGPALYAAGDFTSAGDVSACNIAKWDGHTWSALGLGVGYLGAGATSMAVFDDGSGPALYVGGYFVRCGTLRVNYIAKWDGHAWSALGTGVYAAPGASVEALAVFDDGSGPALYVSGAFSSAGGVPVHGFAKWDGTRWSAVSDQAGIGGGFALATFDDGSGSVLYMVGDFLGGEGRVSVRIAKWGCVPGLTVGDTNCNGVVDNFDIHPFVLALCRPEAYAEEYPACDRRTADTNRDGLVNDFDITPFVRLLTGGQP